MASSLFSEDEWAGMPGATGVPARQDTAPGLPPAGVRRPTLLTEDEWDAMPDTQGGAALDSSMYNASFANPDEEARRQKLATALDLRPSHVPSIPDGERDLWRRQYDTMSLRSSNPRLSVWLEDEDNAKVAKDDLDRLQRLEHIVRPSGGWGAWDTAKAIGGGLIRIPEAFYGAAEVIQRAGEPDIPEAQKERLWSYQFAKWLESNRKVMGQFAKDVTGETPEGTIAAGIASGAESVGQMLPGIIASLITKSPAPALSMAGISAFSQAGTKALDEGADPMIALKYGIEDATAEVVTEMIPMFRLIKDVKAGSGIFKIIGNQMLREIPTEWAATAWQNFNEWMNLHPEKTFGEYIDELGPAEVQTTIATAFSVALMGSMGAPFNIAYRRRLKEQQQFQKDFVTALSDESQQSKLRERHGEKFQNLVDHYAKDGGVDTVFVSAEKFTEYFQSQNMDPAAVAEHLGSKDYQEALTLKTNMSVPIGAFANQIAPTDHLQGLWEDIKFNPNEMSVREYAQFEASREQDLQAEIQRMEMEDKEQDPERQVYNDVLGQQLAIGTERTKAQHEALVVAKINAGRAQYRPGKTAWDIYTERGGLTVAREMPTVLKRLRDNVDMSVDPLLDELRAGALQSPELGLGKTLSEWIRDKGGLVDQGGELAARDVDRERKPFQKKIVRKGGMTFDRARELALEAGFPVGGTPKTFLDAFDNDLRGNPVYSTQEMDSGAVDKRMALEELQRGLDYMGVDLQQMSNEEARKALFEAQMEGRPEAIEGTTFDQSVRGSTSYSERIYMQEDLKGVGKFNKSLQDKAIKHFGRTFDARETGYILPDGTMLDLSGRHYAGYERVGEGWRPRAGERDYLKGDRQVDHRELGEEIEALLVNLPDGATGTDMMLEFQKQAGALRFMPGQGISANFVPTYRQAETLIRMWNARWKDDPLLVDVDDPATGFTIASTEMERPTVEKLIAVFAEAKTKDGNLLFPQAKEYDQSTDTSLPYRLASAVEASPEAAAATIDLLDKLGATTEDQKVDGIVRDTVKQPADTATALAARGRADLAAKVARVAMENGKKLKLADGELTEKKVDEALGGLTEDMKAAGEYYQEALPDRLVISHNLSSENLIFADKVGGIAVPSLAVMPEDVAHEGYGDIALIGDKSLADPARVPVLDADAYTVTFPHPEYPKVKTSVAQKVVDEFKVIIAEFNEWQTRDAIWDNAVNRPDPAESIHQLLRSNAMKAAYLKLHGIEVAPAMQEIPARYAWTRTNAWRDFVRSTDWAVDNKEWDDPARQQLIKDAGTAALRAIDEYVAGIKAENAEDESLLRSMSSNVLKKESIAEDGSINYGVLDRAHRDIEAEGQVEVDRIATEKALDEKLIGHEAAFKKWLEEKILSMYGEPFLTVKGKKRPYTLQNIVEYMVSAKLRASEDTLTFGTGKARAAATHQFRNMEEMRKAAKEQILPQSELLEHRDKTEKLLSNWRERVIEHYTGRDWRGNIDTWNALDDSMKALAKWARGSRTEGNMKKVLAGVGFKNVPADVVREGVEAGAAMLVTPVPYFEAKPQRAVSLDEFAGAVIPEDASNEIKAILEKHSIPYKTYPKRFDEAARHAVVDAFRQELSAQGKNVLFQRQGKAIQRAKYDPEKRLITLLKDANFSSFLHETGHYWLDAIVYDAQQPDVLPELKQHVQTLLDWFGVPDIATWEAMTIEQKTPYHEKFANGVLTYFREGKAPSLALREVFANFSRWLKRLYKSIKGTDADVELTDEVRGVMDRLLATQEEINQARKEGAAVDLFIDRQAAGMTEAEWNAYRKTIEKAHLDEEEELQAQAMAEFDRQSKEWWKKEKARVLAEVTDEVDGQPAYRLMRWLNSGQPPVEGLTHARLSRDELRRMFGEEFYKKLPPFTYQAEGGAHPVILAELFGFDDAAAMVKELIEARPRKALIKAETDQRMIELYGDMRSDGSLPEKARQVVFGEGRQKVVMAELAALRKKQRDVAPFVKAALSDVERERAYERRWLEAERRLSVEIEKGANAAKIQALKDEIADMKAQAKADMREGRELIREGVFPMSVLREVARKQIAAKKLNEVRPETYRLAAIKAAKTAVDAAAKNNYAEAGDQKERELLALEMYKQAVQVQAEVKKALDSFKKIAAADKKIAKGRNMDMVNAARAILANYGIGKKGKDAGFYLRAVKQYDPVSYASLEEVVAIASEKAAPWKELAVEDFFMMRDSVSALWDMARFSQTVRIEGQRKSKEEIVKELVAWMGQYKTLPRGAKIGPKDPRKYESETAAWAYKQLLDSKAHLQRAEFWAEGMDMGKAAGPFKKYITNVMMQAVNMHMDKRVPIIRQYLALLKGLKLHNNIIMAPELGLNSKGEVWHFKGKGALLHALAHTGNDSNMDKFVRGFGWGKRNEMGILDTSKWDAFLQRAYKEGIIVQSDYEVCQAVWNIMESLKPDAQKAHRAMYGRYFAEVTARPIVTPWGVYPGGYIPAKGDPMSPEVQERETKRAVELGEEESFVDENDMFMFPDSFTKTRTGGAYPLLLDLGYLPAHIDQVLRFTYIKPAAMDVRKILKDPDFMGAIGQRDSRVIKEMILPWLDRTARQIGSTPGKGPEWWNNGITAVRKKTGIMYMFGNIPNTIQQLTSFALAKTKIKPRYLRNAAVKFASNPAAYTREIVENDSAMEHRLKSDIFEVQEGIRRILKEDSAIKKASGWADEHGYFMQKFIQNQMDIIVYSAAFAQAKDGKLSDEKARTRANQIVRMTQSAMTSESISKFEAGSPLQKMLSMFMNYFNAQLNLIGERFISTIREYGFSAQAAPKLFYVYWLSLAVPAIVSTAIMMLMTGDLWDDDDDDGYLDTMMDVLLLSQVRNITAMAPGGQAISVLGINQFDEKQYNDRLSMSPVISAIEASSKAPKELYGWLAEDEDLSRKGVRDVFTLMGFFFPPITAAARPLGYYAAVEQGREEPANAADFLRGLVVGR